MSNRLQQQTSPYLLQHANNPVDWYPWGREAFEKAKAEEKPVFLSIGYSTCHWCHVMAHESFEDEEVAKLLNDRFVSIKVDKEERPDIDSIYMEVCQALTGGGGWPTSIFMTAEQKPFFAGTYFPKHARMGMPGFYELLLLIAEKWDTERATLFRSSEEITAALQRPSETGAAPEERLLHTAVSQYQRAFDARYGGFGDAPKFPASHNLLFLMTQYEKTENAACLQMAEKTLSQIYRGGMFDHIGYGFCRYSTDRRFLIPHFEKMLYDNALLILSYCQAYAITKTPLYLQVAERTAAYILREMTSPEGGFYSAQDADSEGVEGKYYLFSPEEIVRLLGEETGAAFCRYYDITEAGNFEGRSIPNLLKQSTLTNAFDPYLPTVYGYRRQRSRLQLDDKILTGWNGLMIAALCRLYRVSRNPDWIAAAQRAQAFLLENSCVEDTLYVSVREGRRSEKGFLEEYANVVFALLELYEATLNDRYLKNARHFFQKAVVDFYDEKNGGFYLYGEENEQLILRPKDTYDGALPSGNSMMAHHAVRLYHMTGEEEYDTLARHQLAFLSAQAAQYPIGHAMFLTALSDHLSPPEKIVIAAKQGTDLSRLPCELPYSARLTVTAPSQAYPLRNDQTTFYVCRGHACLPPVNRIEELEQA